MTYRGNYLRAGFVNYPQYRFTLDDCDVSRVMVNLMWEQNIKLAKILH